MFVGPSGDIQLSVLHRSNRFHGVGIAGCFRVRPAKNAVAVAPIVVILMVIGLSARVDAYVDFGSGSYLLQLLLAGLFSLMFSARALWTRIRAMFGRSNRGK